MLAKAIKDLELSARTSRINSRASSKESVQRIPVPTPVRTGHKSRLLMQNNSKERCTKAAPLSQHRFQSNSLDRFSRASSSSNRKVSLSPASSTRSKRFDPTEYIRQKKTKELNTQQRNRSRNNSSNNYNNLSSDDCSKASANNQRPRSKLSKKRSNLLEDNQENISQQNRPKLASNINNYNRDEEMREIDAKLKSLHNLIKYSL